MNPIYLAGGLAITGAFAASCYFAYGAGKNSVQTEWDKAKLEWVRQKSVLDNQVLTFERSIPLLQQGAENAKALAQAKADELLALQRTRTDTAVAGLRDVQRTITERLTIKSDDSTALIECKATAIAYRNVFDSCVDRYRELGEQAQADQSRRFLAGQQCERAYDTAEAGLRDIARARP